MKPQRFEIGQAVTPKYGVKYKVDPMFPDCTFPKCGEIYHVIKYYWVFDDWFISVEAMSDTIHRENIFDPVELTTEQISELLEQPQTVEA